MATTTLTAPDIVCGGCANAIKKAVGALPGVSAVEVEVDSKRVTVTHEPAATHETLIGTLDRAGFPATVETVGESSDTEGPSTSGGSCCNG